MATLRILCTDTNFAEAANVGGPAFVTHKTFDIELPRSVVEWLDDIGKWNVRGFVGVEVIREVE